MVLSSKLKYERFVALLWRMSKLKLSTLYKAANSLSVNPAFIFWSIRDVPGKRGVWMRKEDLGGQPFRPQSLSPPSLTAKSLVRKAAVKSVGYWNGQKNRKTCLGQSGNPYIRDH